MQASCGWLCPLASVGVVYRGSTRGALLRSLSGFLRVAAVLFKVASHGSANLLGYRDTNVLLDLPKGIERRSVKPESNLLPIGGLGLRCSFASHTQPYDR